MRDTARAFWVTAPGRVEIHEVTVASPREDEILVLTRYSGVSRGTEALVFAGRVPRSEWTRMRAPFQEGVFPAPVKYGYMNVGVVEIGPARLRGPVRRVARHRQQSPARPTETALVGFKGNVVTHELEDLLRVLVHRRGEMLGLHMSQVESALCKQLDVTRGRAFQTWTARGRACAA